MLKSIQELESRRQTMIWSWIQVLHDCHHVIPRHNMSPLTKASWHHQVHHWRQKGLHQPGQSTWSAGLRGDGTMRDTNRCEQMLMTMMTSNGDILCSSNDMASTAYSVICLNTFEIHLKYLARLCVILVTLVYFVFCLVLGRLCWEQKQQGISGYLRVFEGTRHRALGG